MTDEQTKQAILGFAEFFKGITGNQNLEIPSEIAEKCGIQAQADGEYILKSEAIKAIRKDIMGGLNYESILRDMPSVAIPSAEPKTGYREYNDIYDHYLCGNCKTVVMDYDNFCPNCGCRMVEPQERKERMNERLL